MNEPNRHGTGAAARGDGNDAARAAKARRHAWLLAGAAVLIYIGYLITLVIRGS
jgi:hypothetical protein